MCLKMCTYTPLAVFVRRLYTRGQRSVPSVNGHIVGIKTSMAILGPRAAVPGRTRTRALQAGREGQGGRLATTITRTPDTVYYDPRLAL